MLVRDKSTADLLKITQTTITAEIFLLSTGDNLTIHYR